MKRVRRTSSRGFSIAHQHIEEVRGWRTKRVCSDYAKSMEGKRAKCVRKLGGGEEDKGGDLLPKLLSMPLLPAHRLLAPNLLWVLVIGRVRVVGEEL